MSDPRTPSLSPGGATIFHGEAIWTATVTHLAERICEVRLRAASAPPVGATVLLRIEHMGRVVLEDARAVVAGVEDALHERIVRLALSEATA